MKKEDHDPYATDLATMKGQIGIALSNQKTMIDIVRETHATTSEIREQMRDFINDYSQRTRCYFDEQGRLICPKPTKAAIHEITPEDMETSE
jgi:5,10-methenyltetrahydromethanopterin hydrogenase